MVNADAPWVFLWLPQDIYGVSKRVSGWSPARTAASTCTTPASRQIAGRLPTWRIRDARRGHRYTASAAHPGAVRRQRHRLPDDHADARRPGRHHDRRAERDRPNRKRRCATTWASTAPGRNASSSFSATPCTAISASASFTAGRSSDVIAERLPATIELTPGGADHRAGHRDPAGRAGGGQEEHVPRPARHRRLAAWRQLPGFWFGILLLMLFAVQLQCCRCPGASATSRGAADHAALSDRHAARGPVRCLRSTRSRTSSCRRSRWPADGGDPDARHAHLDARGAAPGLHHLRRGQGPRPRRACCSATR